MHLQLVFVVALVIFDRSFSLSESDDDDAIKAEVLADTVNEQLRVRYNTETIANWNYESNLTDHNQQIALNISTDNAKYGKIIAKQLKNYNYNLFENEDLKRKFKLLSDLDDAVLPDDQYEELYNAISAMEQNYAKVKVCDFKNSSKCDLSLEPGE
jgi:peptidyl-dipeptidase A